MVLSWRVDAPTGPSNRIFDGSGDIRKSFFFFENVTMRGKKEEDKSSELLRNLDGNAFEFFIEQFISDGILTPEGADLSVEAFEDQEQPQEIIGKKMVASIDPSNFVTSMN